MTASGAAIVVENVGKVFNARASLRDLVRGRLFGRPLTALADVSFSVAAGESVCVMGPNGAGKSTLLRVLGGLLLPSTGRATLGGEDASVPGLESRRRVSFVVGDERSFHFRVSGRGNLHYFAALHGLSGPHARSRAGELLERVGLAAAADRDYREYSRGMRQRPTLGLDPRGARDLRAFLREDVIRKPGRTAVVCSNDPAEARALADRVLFLEGGHLRGEGPPDRIEAELGL